MKRLYVFFLLVMLLTGAWQATTPEPQILSFSGSPDPVHPVDGVLHLTWDTANAGGVDIEWYDKDYHRITRAGLPPSGSLDVPMSDIAYSGDVVMLSLYLTDGAGERLVMPDGWTRYLEILEVGLQTPIEIVTFSGSPSIVAQGGEVTIHWDVRNAAEISINGFDRSLLPVIPLFGRPGDPMPLQGSYTVHLPDSYLGRKIGYHLLARDENGVMVRRVLELDVRCPFENIIAPRCPYSQVDRVTRWQPFDGGHMLAFEDWGTVALLNDGRMYLNGDVPEMTEGAPIPTPPAERYAPDALFAQRWYADMELQSRMGWATAPLQQYTTRFEQVADSDYNVIHTPTFYYFRWVDGRVIELDYTTGGWRFVE